MAFNYHQDFKPSVNERTYQEVEYLKKNLGPILVAALAEICIRRPADPIEYLGHWLLRWRYNEELKRRDVQNALEVVRQKQWAQAQQEAAGLVEAPQPAEAEFMEIPPLGSGAVAASENLVDTFISEPPQAQWQYEHEQEEEVAEPGPFDIVAEPEQEVFETEFNPPPVEENVAPVGEEGALAEGQDIEGQHEQRGSLGKVSPRKLSAELRHSAGEVPARKHSKEEPHGEHEHHKTPGGQSPPKHHDEPRKTSVGKRPSNGEESRKTSLEHPAGAHHEEGRKASGGGRKSNGELGKEGSAPGMKSPPKKTSLGENHPPAHNPAEE